jgi:putative ABC transport system permease protein
MAGWLLRTVALVTPREWRAEWLEEWEGELSALDAASPAGGTGLPGPLAFVIGAVPHALWLRKEDWTMEGLVHDIRFAFRVLLRTPGFTVVAALTLALGIGANATVFSLVNGLVLRSPAGVVAPDRMVQIARSYENDPRWDVWSWPALQEIRRDSQVFEDVIGYEGLQYILGSGVAAETVIGQMVTGNYFRVLGVKPAAGRLIEASDAASPGSSAVAVLGFDLWQRRFGGDRSVIGESVELSGRQYEVIGIAPRGFAGIETLGSMPQLYVPATMHPVTGGMLPYDRWGWSWIAVAGRLRDGVSIEQARAAMGLVSARLREAGPVNEGLQVLLERGLGLDPTERAEANRLSFLLSGIAALVLLLTCANVANLFIARATTRSAEMGVRIALGAGRGRITRQLGTESIVLALCAAVLAIPVVVVAARFLPKLLPYPISTSLAPDARVFGVLVVLGALAGLLFGAGPSVMIARRNLVHALREGGATGATAKTRLRDVLVVGQLAVSVSLLAAAALLGRSVLAANHADPGFQPRGLLVASLDLDLTGRYDRESAAEFYDRVERAAAAVPGVDAVAIASQAPFVGPFMRATRTPLEHKDDPDAGVEALAVYVDEAYFRTMGIPIVKGRDFDPVGGDAATGIIVNETLARMFWPGQDPIGQLIDAGPQPRRVIGVASDIRSRSLRGNPGPAYYEPLQGAYSLGGAYSPRVLLHLRTSLPPMSVARALRERIAELDPGLPVTRVADIHVAMAASLGETRTIGMLVATFAALALVLSSVGLYGIIAYGVSRRVREMGIRKALGADPRSLVRLIMARGLGLAIVGLVAGTALALIIGRAIGGLLYGVSAASPLTLAVTAITLFAAAALASWLPARSASRVDPAVSLRA